MRHERTSVFPTLTAAISSRQISYGCFRGFTFGNLGRNTLEGPGFANVDYSVFKNIRVHEGHNLQFRAEMFNIFNRTNYNLPGASFGTPSFAVISSTQPARQIQFALKYLF